jgi:hypothetical protein
LDPQELKVGSEHIQVPSKFRSWTIGLSRIEGRLRTQSRAFKLEKLASGIEGPLMTHSRAFKLE